jgi:hypothetical protein
VVAIPEPRGAKRHIQGVSERRIDPNFAIDLDRGVTHSRHPSGMDIYMYKDDPGVYYTAKGAQVPPAVAAHAGFDVKRYEKARQRKIYLAQAAETINRQQGEDEENEVVREEQGFQIIHLKHGRHQLVSPAGDEILPEPQPLEMVELVLKDFLNPVDTGEEETPKVPLKAASAPKPAPKATVSTTPAAKEA